MRPVPSPRFSVPRIPVLLLIAALGAAVDAPASAKVVTRTIEYAHDGVALEGFLAYDEARVSAAPGGRLPGVLVVHEWWGLNEFAREKARELAAEGYVAFALDMYGKGVRTDDPAEAGRLAGPHYAGDFALMRARARAGLDVLAGQSIVDRERLGAIGFCFGGTTVLQLAFSGAPLRAVVSLHGSLPPPAESDDSAIRASILVLHGADDPMVPPEMVHTFEQAMKRTGADWTLVSYGGAVHSFTNPEVDRRGIPGARYHARTHRRAWALMQGFLVETLGR